MERALFSVVARSTVHSGATADRCHDHRGDHMSASAGGALAVIERGRRIPECHQHKKSSFIVRSSFSFRASARLCPWPQTAGQSFCRPGVGSLLLTLLRTLPRVSSRPARATAHGDRRLKSLPSSSAAQFIWRASPAPQGRPRSPRGGGCHQLFVRRTSQFIIGLWQCGDIPEP